KINYPAKLKQVQEKLLNIRSMKPEKVATLLGRNNHGYGSFQSFSEIVFNFESSSQSHLSRYRRSLDLETATATVSYVQDGVQYRRDYFVSYPDQVIVIKLSSDQPGKISFSADLTAPDNRSK